MDPTGIFHNIPCVAGEACTVERCLFSHALRPQTIKQSSSSSSIAPIPVPEVQQLNSIHEPANKAASQPHDTVVKKRKLNEANKVVTAIQPPGETKHVKQNATKTFWSGPSTLEKLVSPPLTKAKAHSPAKSKQATKVVTNEVLHPRTIDGAAAPFAKRKLFLDLLHHEMTRQNNAIIDGHVANKALLTLSAQELFKACLDEEEALARQHSNVYANMIKHRIFALKKMSCEAWLNYVKSTFPKQQQTRLGSEKRTAESKESKFTYLSITLEHLVLSQLRSDQNKLVSHGYIITPPTESQIAQSDAAVALAEGWEICNRCSTRFQCFPDRRAADGMLTIGGPCIYHHGRIFRNRQDKGDVKKHGERPAAYTCCDQSAESEGCTRLDTHVFKVSDAARLASTFAFICTPENNQPAASLSGKVPKAVTFDCEMCYTSYGFELVRLTAVSWPENEQLIDVLVRPQGAILDLNTRFSGVSPETYALAPAYDSDLARPVTVGEDGSKFPIRIMPEPALARSLLCSFLTPQTPLLGHALENDLNVIRLCHPFIVDTVVLYPHRQGLPYRNNLKFLSKTHLGRDVQTSDGAGHDSLEDAQATGDLVRRAVFDKWERMQRRGWTVKQGSLVPPSTVGPQPKPTVEGLEQRKAEGHSSDAD